MAASDVVGQLHAPSPVPTHQLDARISRLGGLSVGLIGTVALTGWLIGSRTLTAVSADFIPVAPNTAGILLLLGASIYAMAGGGRRARLFARLAIGVSFVVAGARLLEYLLGQDLRVDQWVFAVPHESVGLAPVGKMSFFTALSLGLACLALFAQSFPKRPRAEDDLVRAVGLLVTLGGLVFSLGYVYHAPLLYGGQSIPMALPSAIAFVLLGLSIAVPASLRDHATRREAQLALRRAHDELKDHITERTAELTEANEQLQTTEGELKDRTRDVELAGHEASAAEVRYRALIDGLAIGVILMAPDGIQAANPSAARILGLSVEEMLGRAVVDPRWRAVREDGSPFPSEEYPVVSSLRGESRRNVVMGIYRPDGTLAWVEVSSDPLIRSGEVMPYAAVASFVDISKRKRAQEELRESEDQLRQAQKMEAIGELAGGVAHDFNNMLTAIMSYSAMLLDALEPSDPNREDVGEIKKAADRAALLTRQLLAFSRRQMLQPRVLDLNATVLEMEKMLRRLVVEDIELVTALAPALGRVRADPGQIEQVLMNLVVNARDALPGGGTVTIETANIALDRVYGDRHTPIAIPPGPYVRLTVSDTGVGMDAATQTRIFEPFFTTKAKGVGTGLGLSTVLGIVKQSGGYIWCYTEAGRGTSFSVYLPRVDALVEETAVPCTGRTVVSGSETVLLVEDDGAVRLVARRILAKQGYTVLEARNGAEALRLCDESRGRIDLLMSDMVMPEMSGPELARLVHARYPEIRALFTSGYTAAAALRQSFLEPGAAFIEKPFAPQALAAKVREVLDAPATRRIVVNSE